MTTACIHCGYWICAACGFTRKRANRAAVQWCRCGSRVGVWKPVVHRAPDFHPPDPGGVRGSFYRRGTCEVCGGAAERNRVMVAGSERALLAARDEWLATPLRHRRCETPT